MTDLRKAAQQALEALSDCIEKFYAMRSIGVIDALPLQAVSGAQAITALRAALAQPDVPDEQARDAERYRWLRHALSDNGPNGKSHWFCSISAGHPEELDSAIDAAMKGGEA